jgi:hypothetical protein
MQPDDVICIIPTRNRAVTAEKAAINCVMAGCRPEYLPVLMAAVAAVAEPEFNLLGVQTTTGNVSVMLLVNGPVTRRCEINTGSNALGPGARANATIGRAMSLILRNIGEAIPGKTDMATMGQPGKYGFCCAENEQANPWGALHETRGFSPGDSTVTVMAASGIMEIVDSTSNTGEHLLTTFARSMTIAGTLGGSAYLGGGQPLLLMSPEHAAIVARTLTRAQAQAFLHEAARLPLADLSPDVARHLLETPGGHDDAGEDVRVAATPEDVLLAVVGGIGIKSAYVPSWGGGSRAVTKRVPE